MPTVDKDRFPKFIIQIPEEEFPDKLKIVVTGRETFAGADAKKQQLAAEARSLAVGAAGQPLTAPYFTKTYEEGDFKKTINGKKTAELKTPYDEISLIVGYAHREDPEDETPVNVNIFTTTQSSYPSARSTTYNLSGVFAYNFTMVKYNMDADYITQYIKEATPVGQAGQVAAQFGTLIPQVIAAIMNPSLPTPKQIASKVLGPAAAKVQNAIAKGAETVAKVKKTTDQIQEIINAIKELITNPETAVQYVPVIVGWLIKYVGQEKISEIVYSFRG